MKNYFLKITIGLYKLKLSLLSTILMCTLSFPALSSTISIDILNSNPMLGSTFSLAVQGDFSGDSFTNVSGGNFSLNFNPAVLEIAVGGVSIDPTWNFFPTPGTVDNSTGTLTDVFFSAFPAVSGLTSLVDIASITFNVIGTGISDLILSQTATGQLFSPYSANFGAIEGFAVDFSNGSVTVSAIPEPSLLLLLSSALVGLSFRKKYSVS